MKNLFLLFVVIAPEHVGTQRTQGTLTHGHAKHARHVSTQDTLARKHLSTQDTLAREYLNTQDTLPHEHVSTQSTLARGHVSTQGTLPREHVRHAV